MFTQYEDVVVIDLAELESGNKDSSAIARNTVNTWQPRRSAAEKENDTEQGKIAEAAVEKYIHENTDFMYLSYDEIRNDNFAKHAPCDGFLFSNECSRRTIDLFIQYVRDIISATKGISVTFGSAIRSFAAENGILFVEIKSTKVNQTKRNRAKFESYEDDEQVFELIRQIKRDDYLTYPHYSRYGAIDSTQQYISFLVEYGKIPDTLSPSEKMEEFVRIEREAALADIFIRVYIDYEFGKALIIGYITKNEFIDEDVQVKKMIKWGKSQGAIYLAKPLTYGSGIDNLNNE